MHAYCLRPMRTMHAPPHSRTRAGMFSYHFAESALPRITLPDVGLEVFRAIVRYIYFDALPDEAELDMLVLPLLQQAQMMGLMRLSRQCQRYLEAAMAMDNAAAMLQSADTYGAGLLRAACMKHILDNFPTVSTSYGFINLRQDLMREVLHRRAERECGIAPAPPTPATGEMLDAAAATASASMDASGATARRSASRAMHARRTSRSLDQALHCAQSAQLDLPYMSAHGAQATPNALLNSHPPTVSFATAAVGASRAMDSLMAAPPPSAAAASLMSAPVLFTAAPPVEVAASAGKRRRAEPSPTALSDGASNIPRMASGGWNVRALMDAFARDESPSRGAASGASTTAAVGVDTAAAAGPHIASLEEDDADGFSYDDAGSDAGEETGSASASEFARRRGPGERGGPRSTRARRVPNVKRTRPATPAMQGSV